MSNVNTEALVAPVYFGNGANRLKIGTDGTTTMEGTATSWKDITGSTGAFSLAGVAGKADYDLAERLILLEPSGALATEADVVDVKFQLQHDMKAGTPLKLHLHWRQPNATCVFQWKYRVMNNGSASTLGWTTGGTVAATGAANAFAYTSGTLDQITMLGDIPTAGLGISSLIQVKLARTDATAGNVYIYDIDCHYEVDSFGSSLEYVK